MKNNDLGLLILRLSIGILMIFHGISKMIYGIDFIEGLMASKGLPGFFAYGVYVGEVLVPLAIIFGVKTRIAAIIFAFNMLVAIASVHLGDLFSISEMGGWKPELPGLYLFGAVALIFTGGGKYVVCKKYA